MECYPMPDARLQTPELKDSLHNLFFLLLKAYLPVIAALPGFSENTVRQEEFAVPSNELSVSGPDLGYCQRARVRLDPTPT